MLQEHELSFSENDGFLINSKHFISCARSLFVMFINMHVDCGKKWSGTF